MFDIDGIEGNPLLDFAGGWLVFGFILFVAGIAAGAIVFAFGHRHRHQGMKITGMIMVPIALLGAVVLGNINGAISWSSTDARTESVLPKDARQRSITVEKVAPKYTCPEIKVGTGTFDRDYAGLYDHIKALLGEDQFNSIGLSREEPWNNRANSVQYTPQGPDCSQKNTKLAECTSIRVDYTDFPSDDENWLTRVKKLEHVIFESSGENC